LTGGISFNVSSLIVWIHVLAGITWIGLLYYFNFVQVPALAQAAASDQGGPGGAGISKYVAPRALLWFRWGACRHLADVRCRLPGRILAIFARAFTRTQPGNSADTASGSAPGSARSCCSTSGS
jgi:uncharacterized membrane protein